MQMNINILITRYSIRWDADSLQALGAWTIDNKKKRVIGDS